jgi:hypothetical protein
MADLFYIASLEGSRSFIQTTIILKSPPKVGDILRITASNLQSFDEPVISFNCPKDPEAHYIEVIKILPPVEKDGAFVPEIIYNAAHMPERLPLCA